ncbi:MAG: aminotransferase class III-fold pyridoxal phosphate-dependent enzyme, partial [Dolichospermum sp.]
LINGMEIKADIPLTAAEIVKAAMEAGLLLVPAGPKVVRFVPPLIVTEAEINQALKAVEKALAKVTA